jgi:Domian of unknown function (DUF4952)
MCCVIWFRLLRKPPILIDTQAGMPWLPALLRRLWRSAWMLASALFMLHAAAARAAAPACDDFLQRAGRKPAHLQFVGCMAGKSAQIAVLEAKYRVEGRHAAAVERYFMRYTAMQPLRFVCCGWEALPNRQGARWGRLRGHTEFDLEIAMMSGETLKHSRRDWPLIDRFEVTVRLPLESP